MNFCSECDNMYYTKINKDDLNKLIFYCRKCGNENMDITNSNNCICKYQLRNKTQSFEKYINKYTKLDPTLPRVNNMLCPNSECITNTTNAEKEIITIRYDDINMKYVYLCCICDNVWVPNN